MQLSQQLADATPWKNELLMKQTSARCRRHPAVLMNHSNAGSTLWYAPTALFLLGSELVLSLYMVKMISMANLLSEGQCYGSDLD